MKPRIVWPGASLVFCVLFVIVADVCPADKPADMILHNGDVCTVNPQGPLAQAIGIRDGRIVAVGADHDVLSLAGTDTRRIALKCRTNTVRRLPHRQLKLSSRMQLPHWFQNLAFRDSFLRAAKHLALS